MTCMDYFPNDRYLAWFPRFSDFSHSKSCPILKSLQVLPILASVLVCICILSLDRWYKIWPVKKRKKRAEKHTKCKAEKSEVWERKRRKPSTKKPQRGDLPIRHARRGTKMVRNASRAKSILSILSKPYGPTELEMTTYCVECWWRVRCIE